MTNGEKTRKIQHLRAILLMQGLTLKDFARREGFEPSMVGKVVRRYWGTDDYPPRGVITHAILDRLRQYCGNDHGVTSSTGSTLGPTGSTP